MTVWKNVVFLVIARDKECKRCGSKEDLGAHHIIPRDENGSNSLDNLICLCNTCHDWVEERLYLEDYILKNRDAIIDSYPYVMELSPPSRDVLNVPKAGEKQPGDKADIWARWITNGRRGAANLIEMYGG